jgi:hypothetical protein
MAHNHGSEYQVKVIHEDGTEALSEWIEHGNVAHTMAALRQATSQSLLAEGTKRYKSRGLSPLPGQRNGHRRISFDGLFVSPEPPARMSAAVEGDVPRGAGGGSDTNATRHARIPRRSTR